MKIDAEKQFQPTQQSVAYILASYDLSLISFEPAQTGIENCTLFVTTNKGDFVLRVYRQSKKTSDEIALELDFIRYLDENGIPVAAAIASVKGEYVIAHQGWQSILMRKVAGKHAHSYDGELVRNLSVLQAKMHMLSQEYKSTFPILQPLSILEDTIFIPKVDTSKINSEAHLLLKRALDYTVSLPVGLPTGLCHLDYDADNVLFDEAQQIAAVLDFDDLALAPFVVCLSYTLWDVMSQEDTQLVKDYITSYATVRNLTNQELELIPKIMLFRHYMIAGLVMLDGDMDAETTAKYIRVEQVIMSWQLS